MVSGLGLRIESLGLRIEGFRLLEESSFSQAVAGC